MKYYEFNYYKKFKCIDKNCRHNCCIGWEIDIDDTSLNKYKTFPDIKDGINFKNKCFKLRKDGKCYFLDNDNLCKIIKSHGENSLCEICSLHPRFKNFFLEREETGLGLTCEEAGRIILTEREKIRPVFVSGETEKLSSWEEETLLFREKLIKVIQNKNLPIRDRIKNLEKIADTKEDELLSKVNGKFLSSLEILSKVWKTCLYTLNNKPKITAKFNKEYENLISYFIYRHITNAFDGKDLITRTKFCLLSYYVIKRLCDIKEENGGCKIEDLIEYARAYSSEIEYSDDNFNKILDKIEE